MTDTLTARSAKKKRLPEIMRLLRQEHPDATCALNFTNALELLVATILSAQCTDVRVNQVTPDLFAKYPNALAFAEADITELEEAIRSTGFYRNKAKNIQATCRKIMHEYGGEVPNNMADLLTLNGVARKTANVVLGDWFKAPVGVVVDTHVKRLSNRLNLTKEQTPEKIERDLMALTDQSEWVQVSHLIIFHGRRICNARKPKCSECVISHLCPSKQL